METLTGLCVLLAVLSRAVTGDTVTEKYFTDNGKLTLEVRPPYSEPIINILWKFNGNLLAEWVKDKVPLELYNTFRGRTSLDTGTGLLTVRNMSKEDSGEYLVEINNKVHGERYNARLIKKVPKPKVVVRPLTCGAETETCTASCDADTNQAEPVNYKWKIGDGDWVQLKDLQINKTNNVDDEFITCQISNPLSEEVSATIKNPLYEKKLSPGEIAGIVIGGVLLPLVLGVLVLMWKKKKGPFKNRNTNNTDPVPKANAPPPGDSPKTSPEEHPLNKTSSDGKDTA